MADALEVQIRADASAFTSGMNDAIAGLNRLVARGEKASKSTQQTAKSMQSLATGMKAFGVGIAAAIGTQVLGSLQQLGAEFIRLAEAPTQFKASIEALTGSTSRAQNMLQRVYDVAKRTGSGFEETASMVQRLTIGLQALGANNAQIAQISENIIKLGTIGGSSMADTAAAAMQLSQALASGKLQGDELRSIVERMPKLMKILADEMGVSVGQMKKLGSEGKITSDVMANALLKATQKINEDFAKMPMTVERAMNNIKTSIQQAFDNPGAKAAVQGLAAAINKIPVAIRTADVAVRGFMTNLSRFGKDMGNFFEPLLNALNRFGRGLAELVSQMGPLLAPIKNILLVAFVGPIVAIIAKWDELTAYFNNKIPAMFNSLISVAASALSQLIKIFADAWNSIVSMSASAIQTIAGYFDTWINRINSVSNALGKGNIAEPFGKITLDAYKADAAVKTLTATSEVFGKSAASYNQKYATDMRTIARTTAETTAVVEAGTAKWEDYNKALEKISTATGGGGGGGKGGGGKSGGAAGGIKKAGDAAKKAGEQMDAAKKQAEEFGQAMASIAQSLGSGVVDALFSIADGSKSAKEAFTELAKSMLKQIAQMIMQMLILKPLMGMFGGGMGLFGGGGGGLMSMAARSGPALMGASGSGTIGSYSGFNMSPAAMTSMRSSAMSTGSVQHQAPMNVTINNQSGAQVKTRRNEGELTIDIIEDVVSDRITRGGNKIDAAMQRAFGARRVGY